MTWTHNHLALSPGHTVEIFYRRQGKDEPFGCLDTGPLLMEPALRKA